MKFILAFIPLLADSLTAFSEAHLATGVKVGEVSDTSAIVWVRLTKDSKRKPDGILPRKRMGESKPRPLAKNIKVADLQGSCPGAEGKVGLRYASAGDKSPFDANLVDVLTSKPEWAPVSASTDYTHPFHLENLQPNTTYVYGVHTILQGDENEQGFIAGAFRTAPSRDESQAVKFTTITCQAYKDKDRLDGFYIYESMMKLKPNFIVPTGDTVYYDNDPPLANTVDVARYHWHRMYSLPTLLKFHLWVPGYWIKDDHDTLSNNCWPTENPEFMAPMTFEDGQSVFREQVPMGEKTYRTFRWGKHLQIWFTEGRDFRSPNDAPDGPGKTIWGEEQKRWFFESLLASDADWRILVSATPIVGPDHGGDKADNHVNDAFAWEGNQIRNWIAENSPNNMFVVCGDRHWQYESIDPETKVHEFSCGPASDRHAAGVPKDSSDEYEWYRVRGGFLSVSVTPQGKGSRIALRHHDVVGDVVNEFVETTP